MLLGTIWYPSTLWPALSLISVWSTLLECKPKWRLGFCLRNPSNRIYLPYPLSHKPRIVGDSKFHLWTAATESATLRPRKRQSAPFFPSESSRHAHINLNSGPEDAPLHTVLGNSVPFWSRRWERRNDRWASARAPARSFSRLSRNPIAVISTVMLAGKCLATRKVWAKPVLHRLGRNPGNFASKIFSCKTAVLKKSIFPPWM